MRPNNAIWWLCLALCPMLAAAFPGESDEPINVIAQEAELDELKGKSVYIGDVVVTQGKSKLIADKVTVFNNKDGITKIIAIGKPAHVIDVNDKDGTVTDAFGNTITYDKVQDLVTLDKNARVVQGANESTGNLITYDLTSRKTNVKSNAQQDDDRVTFTFDPKNPVVNPAESESTGNPQ